jgi:hypothetical protein|tara:strand:+ start:516 stop:908 length:393 start_codon:yes stop_codon:yes gene_type:complete
MVGFLGLKTIDVIESKRKDPNKSLWRNVLIVAIEDAIKATERKCMFREFYANKRNLEIEYVTEPNQDFATVCHYADLDHSLVRSKVKRTLNRIEDNYAKKDMSELQREWVSKGNRNERALRISRSVNKAV